MILEEGNLPYPMLTKCDTFLSHKALNIQNLAMTFCCRGEERKWRRLEKEEAQTGTELEITAYGITIAPVTYFKYLGKVLLAEDNDWPAVVHNLWRARKKWAQLTSVLRKEGADARTSGQIYLSVVQSVMLYG